MAWVARHRRVLFAVCGALIAAVLGAAVQEILDTRLRMAAAAALVVCLLVVTMLAGLAAVVESRIQADREITDAVRDEVARHHALADGTAARIAALGRDMTAMVGSIGMKVDTMLLSELNTAKTIEGDRTVQLMLSAKEEIRILDLLLEDGRWPDEAMDQSYQNNAFDVFLALLEQPSISYKRIIQVAEPASSLSRALTPSLVKHCTDVLALRQARGRVSLRVTRHRFPFKFILIDTSAIVLQLQEYGGHTGDLRIWGEVLITDPGGQLVAVFRAIWDEFVEDPSTRAVRLADLPRPGGSPAE
ncbi:hypothetical protein [Paractinoplanes toevensis]|uniref:Uncharacterized protein n=1 Tax=Paractinoplanes toevensis TaxID=571911 RepID=A0A920BQ05_9ACTN|nr:hypothetical protein [Actinoplanes toevensis]GIM96585.1 hypothetical protein Ato02nite_083780 [Actinoplanes toevensis]